MMELINDTFMMYLPNLVFETDSDQILILKIFWLFKLPLNGQKAKYIAIPLSKYYASQKGETPLTNIFWQVSTINKIPSFNNGKWVWAKKDLFPSNVDSFFTFHARLFLRDNGDFEWVGAY